MSNCIFCTESFTGRSDKKFCSDHCRSAFHHKKQGKTISVMRRINVKLKQNRTLLLKVRSSELKTISKSLLINLGFDFNLVTHFDIKNNDILKFCYDLGYIELNDSEIKIIEKRTSTKPFVK